MPENVKELPINRGCKCGWPIDNCNRKFAKGLKDGQPCPKDKHEAEVQRFTTKGLIEQKAGDAERDAAFYRRTAKLIVVNER